MAWDNGVSENGYAVFTETLTVVTSDSAGQDLTSSVIDFVPAGRDFTVMANTGATDLSSDADIAVYAAGKSTDTFALLKDDLIASLDAKVASAFNDVSLNGEAPYYKLFLDSDDVQKKTDTIILKVLVRMD
jgi:hypothetical protein